METIDGETLTKIIERIGWPKPINLSDLPDYDSSKVEWWKWGQPSSNISTFQGSV